MMPCLKYISGIDVHAKHCTCESQFSVDLGDMASSKFNANIFLLQASVIVLFALSSANAKGLSAKFYSKTCPSVEAIVRKTTASFISRAPTLAAPLLRMHFHDCFVRGCDASILVNSTKRNQAEKSAIPNQFLRGYQVVDAAKAALEKECPGVVSCADILALVARDAVSAIKGPHWNVPLGRRDGRISKASEALNTLPSPFDNITTLIQEFRNKGLSYSNATISYISKSYLNLSINYIGGHTIGTGHCFTFTNRLYNFTGKGDTDPSMDPNYIAHLKKKCKPTDILPLAEMDPGSFRTFDSSYYTMVSKRRGLFESDAALLNNKETRAYVRLQASTHGSTFFRDFSKSMVRMGKVGVLTGKKGEIRKHCAVIN
ncbi:hypothetical protein Sjap_003323 [Stephania japonica]|uniref:Peroxidase n=1 Tax=Stephania japonica TaxID=461633 RepID=A0AAP0PTF3_9MAGN